MKTANIVIKTDPETKRKVQRVARAAGLTLSDLINVRLKEYAEAGAVTIATIPRMSKKLERIVAAAERDLAAGRIYTAGSAEEFIRQLNS